MRPIYQLIAIIIWLHFMFISNVSCFAQEYVSRGDSMMLDREERKQKALAQLDQEDTLSASPNWPNIKPALFFSNIRQNILFPSRINQGKATNFCGYAAFTHILLKYQPDIYLKEILSLYHTGELALRKKTIKPSEKIRKAAGTLKRKGDLDMLHANQLWFLSLADDFKGYLNVIDLSYNIGNENTIWAATNYGKFNKMLKQFGDYRVKAAGSDLIRPIRGNNFNFCTKQLQKGVVMLYINSKWLHPTKYTLFKLRAPTHFVVLYEMYKIDDMIMIKYWDYGLKTEQLITKKRLNKLIFGVTTITNK